MTDFLLIKDCVSYWYIDSFIDWYLEEEKADPELDNYTDCVTWECEDIWEGVSWDLEQLQVREICLFCGNQVNSCTCQVKEMAK